MARTGHSRLGKGPLGRRDRRRIVDEHADTRSAPRESEEPAPKGRREDRPRIMFRVEPELAERVKNTVFGLSGPPVCLTLEELGAAALAAEIGRLEKLHNKGRPYSRATKPLRRGRGTR